MSKLRFLADESCDFSVDSELLEQAHRENRVLLTEDKDFGWLVFVSHSDSAGVVLIRFPASQRSALSQSVLQVVQEHGEKLTSAFVVIQPGQVRFSRKE